MKKLKLLYAEDEQQTRKDHIIYLQSRYNLDIFEADDGIEALALYKKYSPDIVLTDITMPNMCGLELAKEIRKLSKHTKIIILTAHAQRDKLMQAFDLNLINYLIKPINREKLRNSIDVAIETLSRDKQNDNKMIFFTDTAHFDMYKNQYTVDGNLIKLSKSEMSLLVLLCKHINKDLSSYDIFINIWDDFDKEFSPDSVRTLVKKLRKKLPNGILKNIYGGFYKLAI